MAKQSFKEYTAGELTEQANKLLLERHVFTWRNNQLRVKGRTFMGLLGVSDRIGYHMSTGVFCACEVKTIGDKMNDEQRKFLYNLHVGGGFALVYFQDKDGSVKLENYVDSKYFKPIM